jgi:hypothetical protein
MMDVQPLEWRTCISLRPASAAPTIGVWRSSDQRFSDSLAETSPEDRELVTPTGSQLHTLIDSDYLTCDKCGRKARNLVFGEFDPLCHTCDLQRSLFWLFWKLVGFVVISAFTSLSSPPRPWICYRFGCCHSHR